MFYKSRWQLLDSYWVHNGEFRNHPQMPKSANYEILSTYPNVRLTFDLNSIILQHSMSCLCSTSLLITHHNHRRNCPSYKVALSQTYNIRSIDSFFTYNRSQMSVNHIHKDIPFDCSPSTRLNRLTLFYMWTLMASNIIFLYSYF